MNQKNVLKSLVFILLFALTATFSFASPTKKFNPAGTWEYSAPGVAEGYTTGEIVIVENEKGYGITMVLNEYNKVEADKVEYKNKSLEYTMYVENELVTVSGTFEKDKFTGTVSYSEGVFEFTAVRKKEAEKK